MFAKHKLTIDNIGFAGGILTLFRMGFFAAAHELRRGRGQKDPLPKICHTYPTMMKLRRVIPYLNQKMYESRDTTPELC